jgi:predicted lipid-binding transport protein (Tim44 family)
VSPPTRLSPTVVGWSGILAGIGLVLEGALWTASGWTPETFADAEAAMAFLVDGGTTLRWAVLSGFVNLVFFIVFVAGLAARLQARTPTAATATLWFGMLGASLHRIVPLSHWYGVPAFVEAAARDPQAAESAWTAFVVVGHEAAGGAGSLLMGLSMLAAGWAIVAHRALPVLLGWLGLITGAATVLTLFAPETPLSGLAGAMFMPSLLLAIVFRIWAGVALTRPDIPSRIATDVTQGTARS